MCVFIMQSVSVSDDSSVTHIYTRYTIPPAVYLYLNNNLSVHVNRGGNAQQSHAVLKSLSENIGLLLAGIQLVFITLCHIYCFILDQAISHAHL